MFSKIPDNVEELLKKLEQDYPRVVVGIRSVWLQKDAEKFFQSTLTYFDSCTREGFNSEAFRMINEIHNIHREIVGYKDDDEIWFKFR